MSRKNIRIHVCHFIWDKRGVMTRGKETIVYEVTDELKNLTNFKQLPSHGTINEILIDDELNCWFAVNGYDRRQGGLYLKEWHRNHVENIF